MKIEECKNCEHEHCYRCGAVKGWHSGGGCNVYGTYYKQHIWKI